MPITGPPPFDLVQLSECPLSTWKGRAVFHPMEQGAQGPVWEMTAEELSEEKAAFEDAFGEDPGDVNGTAYDVGAVLGWAVDPDFADLGFLRVRFIMSCGSTLTYSSNNLWTPRLVGDP